MTEHGTDEKITIKAAAKALGVTTKTIQRYIGKGLLSKVKQGTRTYLYLSEIRAMLEYRASERGQSMSLVGRRSGAGQTADTITLHRERYESLLIELGELRKQSQFLDEFKAALQMKEDILRDRERDMDQLKTNLEKLEAKDRAREGELERSSTKIRELEAELEQIRALKPWWQR